MSVAFVMRDSRREKLSLLFPSANTFFVMGVLLGLS
jgi:hypothetical protein